MGVQMFANFVVEPNGDYNMNLVSEMRTHTRLLIRALALRTVNARLRSTNSNTVAMESGELRHRVIGWA